MPTTPTLPHRSLARLLPLFAIVALALSPLAARAASLSLTGDASTVTTTYTPGDFFEGFDPIINSQANLSMSATINTSGASGSLVFTIQAPAGYQFNLTATPNSLLAMEVHYNGPGNSGLTLSGTTTVSFADLIGTAPTMTSYSSLSYAGGNTYISQNFNGYFSSSFSFTAVTFTTPISGTGNNVTASISGTPNILVQDTSYSGPSNAALMSLTPIPEPSTYALFAGLAAGACIIVRRRKRAKAA